MPQTMMMATKDDSSSSAVPAAPPTSTSTSTRIHPLPKAVVDRIAAGEVVQRPASVAKELIENCLDADATTIDVQAQAGGLRLLTVTDDGVGISPPDLQLAATRFATSKLVDFEDLKSIRTFGFRGEALASTSMVARVTITSRRRKRKASAGVAAASSTSATAKLDADEAKFSTSCAYKQSYKDGVPNAPKPTPSAGRDGTVIKVEDLFYNVPSRRRAFAGSRKEAEEYARVLSVAQRYAVHRAGRGVGVVCRKKSANADLNTPALPSVRVLKEKRLKAVATVAAAGGAYKGEQISIMESERATRDVIGHIFGSSVAKELLTLHSEEGNVEAVSISALEAMREQRQQQQQQYQQNGANGDKSVVPGAGSASALTSESVEMEMATENNGKENDGSGEHHQSRKQGRYAFAYKAFGLITNGSFCAPKSSSAFVLFINDRLVESAPLRRAVESVYADSLPRGAKPFVYLALELPGPHVDVNVHPTKREVAFLHEDRLCDALARVTKEVVGSAQASRTFYAQAVLPQGMSDAGTITDDSSRAAAIRAKAISKTASQNGADSSKKSKDKDISADDEDEVDAKGDSNGDSGSHTKKRKADGSTPSSTPSSGKKTYDPKRLVRTNSAAPAGALEPFLVSTQSQLSQGQLSQTTLSKSDAGGNGGRALSSFQHAENCELARGSQSIDMAVPGAFALICRCQVERGNLLPQIQNRNTLEADNASSATQPSGIVRPKKITPVHCTYSSIQTLRNDITSRAHRDLTTKLRDSQFVGCVTRSRSLIQWGIELLMINHTELGRELFYQLALSRFGGAQIAELGGGGVNVKCTVEQAMQLEQDIASGLLDGHGIEQDGSGSSCRSTGKPLAISETNNDLARQCELQLLDKAKMLEEYYSIRFRTKVDPATGKEALMLVGLPVLLEGHAPPPHALPLFLLRLATEVDWTSERPCFHDICTELANFYAEMPFDLDPSNEEDSGESGTSATASAGMETGLVDEAAKHFVKHSLYPAISFLLIPPKDFANNGAVVKLAVLSSLYKVFERC